MSLCHGDPAAALDLQDDTLHVLQQFVDGVDAGVGKLRESWIWASAEAELARPSALLLCPGEGWASSPHHATRASSTVVSTLLSAIAGYREPFLFS